MGNQSSTLLDYPTQTDQLETGAESKSPSESARTIIDTKAAVSDEDSDASEYGEHDAASAKDSAPQAKRGLREDKNKLLWFLKKPICQLVIANSLFLSIMMIFSTGRSSEADKSLSTSIPHELNESSRLDTASADSEGAMKAQWRHQTSKAAGWRHAVKTKVSSADGEANAIHPPSVDDNSHSEPASKGERLQTKNDSVQGEKGEDDFYNRKALYSQYIGVADKLYEQRQYQEALRYYQEAADLYPTFQKGDWAHYRLGECLLATEQHEKALASFQTVITRYFNSPYEAKARFKLATCLFAQQHYDRARRAFYALIARQAKYPSEDQKLMAEAYYRIADCYSADSMRSISGDPRTSGGGHTQSEMSEAMAVQKRGGTLMASTLVLHH